MNTVVSRQLDESIVLLEWHLISQSLEFRCFVSYQLCKIGDTVLACLLDGMELLPEVLLDLCQISPGVHLIRFNVLNFKLELLLAFFVTFDVLNKVCVIGIFDDNLGDILGRLNLGDVLFFLEPLSNDIGYGHVVLFFQLCELRRRDQPSSSLDLCGETGQTILSAVDQNLVTSLIFSN